MMMISQAYMNTVGVCVCSSVPVLAHVSQVADPLTGKQKQPPYQGREYRRTGCGQREEEPPPHEPLYEIPVIPVTLERGWRQLLCLRLRQVHEHLHQVLFLRKDQLWI